MAARFDEVMGGDTIPELRREAGIRTLVRFAGATGDFFEIHYDAEAARAGGLPDAIVHGYLEQAYLAEAASRWAGGPHRLRGISAEYRGIDVVSRPEAPRSFTVRGRVRQKWEASGERFVELDLEGIDDAGTVTTPGTAIVSLAD